MLGLKINIVGRNFKAKGFWSKILVFVAFEFIFSAVTMPFLIFFGPFENVKRTMVGTSWATLSHQYIAKFFLSQGAIERILGTSGYYSAEAATQIETKLDLPKFKINHTDKIEVHNIDGGDFVGKLMVIYDFTRVKVGYTSKLLTAGETTSTIAKKSGAIAAINAGGHIDTGWAGTGGTPDGFIIHDGDVVYNGIESEDLKVDVAAFSDKGVLVVGKHSINDLKKYNIQEAISFGPPLVVNGKPTISQGDGGWGIAPRTAIAQRADGAVLFLVVDGRSLKSLGATLRDLQDIFVQFGAVNAVNLDGGSSTTMYFDGKIINKPSDGMGERSLASVFMVLPVKDGAK